MIRPGVGLYINNDWNFAQSYLYTNGAWEQVSPKVYINNNWTYIGGQGTLMVNFITSDNQIFYDSANNSFLVRKE